MCVLGGGGGQYSKYSTYVYCSIMADSTCLIPVLYKDVCSILCSTLSEQSHLSTCSYTLYVGYTLSTHSLPELSSSMEADDEKEVE